jgi:hypothetical protein
LHARDVFLQDFGKVRLQTVNVSNAEQAGRKKKDAEYDGWNRDAKEQFSFHGCDSEWVYREWRNEKVNGIQGQANLGHVARSGSVGPEVATLFTIIRVVGR